MPLDRDQQELMLIHILMTTSSTVYNPNSSQYYRSGGKGILDQIATDYHANSGAGLPLSWEEQDDTPALTYANQMFAMRKSISPLSQDFQNIATNTSWVGVHPDFAEVLEMLDMA